MKIFVTGRTGAIGRPLIAELLAKGHAVVALTRSTEEAQALVEQGIEPAIADVFDADAIKSAVSRAQPEVVIEQLTALPKTYTRESMCAVDTSGLEHSLLELVKTRVSQINGCAFCIDMHTKDARAAGETEQRLYGLSAWHEAPYYTERERAALAWAEVVTLISQTHATDEEYEAARSQFSEEEGNLKLRERHNKKRRECYEYYHNQRWNADLLQGLGHWPGRYVLAWVAVER